MYEWRKVPANPIPFTPAVVVQSYPTNLKEYSYQHANESRPRGAKNGAEKEKKIKNKENDPLKDDPLPPSVAGIIGTKNKRANEVVPQAELCVVEFDYITALGGTGLTPASRSPTPTTSCSRRAGRTTSRPRSCAHQVSPLEIFIQGFALTFTTTFVWLFSFHFGAIVWTLQDFEEEKIKLCFWGLGGEWNITEGVSGCFVLDGDLSLPSPGRETEYKINFHTC
ncbi:hypothetical protein CDAR_263081 [Caerostris darwini]|uniref:Uncharacterized protein n=1 Tax=Caerostris darwini TaxID=1538125 RepID=A0AAV4RXI9_9ARAC|nr:hypothetical protein CDAR_263081 [Caerostris darwini]